MKFSLTTLGVIFTLWSYAQVSLKPAQLVQNAKKEGLTFRQEQLFEPAQQPSYELPRQISDYEVFELDEENLGQMLLDQPARISLPLPAATRSKALEIELVQASLFTAGFEVAMASGIAPRYEQGLHYRGVIKGEPGSVVALSFFENEVMGIVSSEARGNLVLGRLDNSSRNEYILYRDKEVIAALDFVCATSDEGEDYRPEQLEMPIAERGPGDCVGIYLEIDHDVFTSKGGADGTVNYITGLFNQVAALYANESINVRLSEMFLWDTPSPYNSNDSYSMLTAFVNQRPSFIGDLGQLISYKASGGIAYLSGLCNPYAPNHSFSSISSSYAQVPTYSWSAMVITHELGHLFGSRHTHACAWNGNNTAIDGCAGYVEGDCPKPGNPAGGGTMMSYCHLRSVGINFSKGFGQQPGNVIRNAVVNAACLNACSDDGGYNPPAGGCESSEVLLTLVLDQYGIETSWEVRDADDNLLYAGGPYNGSPNGRVIEEALCLEEGCYVFEIFDSFGDGICCSYGQGRYSLRDSTGNILGEGGRFELSETAAFCLPFEEDEEEPSCLEIDFNDYDIQSHGGRQDIGYWQLVNGGRILRIGNNAWKAIELDYEVTEQTVLELEFGSTAQGEIHGIGFDNNTSISSNRTFRLFGVQNWGYGRFDDYPGNATWKKYTIPVGEFFTGNFNRLVFVADHDRYPANGNSYFRNIRLYEGESCEASELGPVDNYGLVETAGGSSSLLLFPNPANDLLSVDFVSTEEGKGRLQVFNLAGQLVLQQERLVREGANREQLQIGDLPEGAYLLRVIVGTEQWSEKFVVTH